MEMQASSLQELLILPRKLKSLELRLFPGFENDNLQFPDVGYLWADLSPSPTLVYLVLADIGLKGTWLHQFLQYLSPTLRHLELKMVVLSDEGDSWMTLLPIIPAKLDLKTARVKRSLQKVVDEVVLELWTFGSEGEDIENQVMEDFLIHGGEMPTTAESMNELVPCEYSDMWNAYFWS